MTSLSSWHSEVTTLAARLRARHPDLLPDLIRISHPNAIPCPPCCPRCHLRHTGPCPCPVCHTTHRRECPPQSKPRPGCLACQLSDDTARALGLADLGDGLRSPSLEPGHGGGGPASAKYADDDERGGVSTTVEAAALKDHPDRGALLRSATHADEAANWLRTALRVSGAVDATEPSQSNHGAICPPTQQRTDQ